MKTKTIITEINHEDLVNLFSCAIYGSNIFDVRIKRTDYYETPLEDENDCREDKWAKVLLSGKAIHVYDNYAEGEHYGNLPYRITAPDGDVCYHVTLADIEAGLSKACSSDSYIHDYVRHLAFEPENLDQSEAEALLQYILFGEEIYG